MKAIDELREWLVNEIEEPLATSSEELYHFTDGRRTGYEISLLKLDELKAKESSAECEHIYIAPLCEKHGEKGCLCLYPAYAACTKCGYNPAKENNNA